MANDKSYSRFSRLYITISYYIFNLVIAAFFIHIYFKQSLSELIVFGSTLLAVIGILSGLCYTGSQSTEAADVRRIFIASGHRFFHCFLSTLFALFFIGTTIQIRSEGFLGFRHKYFTFFITIASVPFVIISLIWASRSFSIGYHMIRRVLDKAFPLRDERLYDDLDDKDKL